LELIPFVGIPFGLIAFVFTTSWYWLVLLPVAVVALFILKVSNGSTANRNAPPTPAPTPVVTSSDPNVRKIISEVALEKVFSANDKRLYGGLANALEQDPAAQESSPIVYQYLIDDAGFAQSLQDIDGIFRRSHNYKPDIVISAKELSLEQKREIVSHLRGKANYQIVDITTETVDLDEVLKQAETLPHVRTLLRQFAGVRVITIDPTGIPFTASEGLQHLMSVVLMNLRGDWAGVSVETAIAAFKDASIKA
jgi:hypothetical protein